MRKILFNARKLLAVCCLMATPALCFAEQKKEDLPDNYFISLTFHDVRDDVLKQGDRDLYAVSTQNLARYFDWLSMSNWKPISLKQIMDARTKGQPLPHNAILLTFDDGALSSYSRVFPLLKQYKIPAVFAIPTSWINGNTKAAYEAYGQGNLMNWQQMREMQQSGVVEFASHAHDLHKGVLANPQNNEQPATLTRQFLKEQNRYEDQSEYQQRIYEDLKLSKQILDRELDSNTLAIIWPYGAVNEETEQIAESAGYPLSFSLGKDGINTVDRGTYQRGLVMDNPTAAQLHEQMIEILNYPVDLLEEPQRFATLNLKELQSNNYLDSDQKLGDILNNLNALSTNVLMIQVLGDQNQDHQYDLAYFPTTHLPVAQDLVNRTVWQTKTRLFQRVFAEIPLYPNMQQPDLVLDLTRDLVRNNTALDGITLAVGNHLQCNIQSQQISSTCEQDFQRTTALIERVKNTATPLLNISNTIQFVFKVPLEQDQLGGLVPTLQRLTKQVEMVNFEIDPLTHPKVLKAFLDQVKVLPLKQKQQVMVTLNNKTVSKPKDWKTIQRAFLDLQRMGIQKFGVGDYSFQQASAIHRNLYDPLSLNNSSLSYRDPFIGLKKQGDNQ